MAVEPGGRIYENGTRKSHFKEKDWVGFVVTFFMWQVRLRSFRPHDQELRIGTIVGGSSKALYGDMGGDHGMGRY